MGYQTSEFSPTAKCGLNFKTISQENLAEKLKNARKIDKTLPVEPKDYRVRMRRNICSYVYSEDVGLDKTNVFVFDALGEMFDNWVDHR